METRVWRSLNEDSIELKIEDEISWVTILELEIDKNSFFEFFIKWYWTMKCNTTFYKESIDNIWKTKEVVYLPYTDVYLYNGNKGEWIKDNTPEWYKYYWDNNYGKTAMFIRYV